MGEYANEEAGGSAGKPYRNIKDVSVEDVFELVVADAATVMSDQKLEDTVGSMVKRPLSQKVYVVDEEKRLLGTITMQNILRRVGYIYGVREKGIASFFKFLRDVMQDNVEDFMEKEPVKVTKKDKILDALKLMVEHNLNNLPVVDENNVLIGELDAVEVLMTSLKE
jgi:CBS domain-containing protein